ncbi:hypothetical protein GCM10007291_07990 [Gemmobacter nanjingensis]|jgi:hypothetical protein|uniref:Argininosuccinate lyase n=1 Tax=Gemmobacter nanjingensis TaxID=488454 RepID=A0ABQ3F827_9RHOB|nr:hypothetical protein [Gemmobacter nanjingensis]GHC13010.1 hypothetical protein GCM10007291_07990 [Gemmobacter nanjingensis]
MRTAAVLGLILLAACAASVPEPQTNLNVHATPTGVAVTPSVSTRVGTARVGVTPHGARIGTRIGGIGIGIGL